MKKLISSLIIVFSTIIVDAEPVQWNLVDVFTKDTVTVGHIYHTYAVGTQKGIKTEKVAAGLRFVCSTKNNNMEPIIAIYWNSSINNISGQTQKVHSSIDGKEFDYVDWRQEGTLLYRPLSTSKEMIEAMKRARLIRFTWSSNDSVLRDVIFDIKTFSTNFNNFSALCSLQ
jgi:hypothetical protein